MNEGFEKDGFKNHGFENEGRSRWVDAGFRLRRTSLASPTKSCEDRFEFLKPGWMTPSNGARLLPDAVPEFNGTFEISRR